MAGSAKAVRMHAAGPAITQGPRDDAHHSEAAGGGRPDPRNVPMSFRNSAQARGRYHNAAQLGHRSRRVRRDRAARPSRPVGGAEVSEKRIDLLGQGEHIARVPVAWELP